MAKAPTPSVYNGLSDQFRARSLNLCSKSLPPESWKAWKDQAFTSSTGERREFSEIETSEEKLNFLDEYLYTLLVPKDMTLPNRNMISRWRADLNKYRGWMVNRILRQMQEIHDEKTQRKDPLKRAYSLPEDLSKIVDDLYLFHKHISRRNTKISREEANVSREDPNIARCADLNALHKLVAPFQPAYPLKDKDRWYAYAQFLETEREEQLAGLLPTTWQVRGNEVIDQDGKILKRKGGARLIAVLEDGTDVIHLKSKQASGAFGSPRWCTVERENNNFRDYQDNLIEVIEPDGRRWQLHLRHNEKRDARDHEIPDFDEFLRQHSGLDEALKAHFKYEWPRAVEMQFFESQANLLCFVEEFPELLPMISKADITTILYDALEEGRISAIAETFRRGCKWPELLDVEPGFIDKFITKLLRNDQEVLEKISTYFSKIPESDVKNRLHERLGRELVGNPRDISRFLSMLVLTPVSWKASLSSEFEEALLTAIVSKNRIYEVLHKAAKDSSDALDSQEKHPWEDLIDKYICRFSDESESHANLDKTLAIIEVLCGNDRVSSIFDGNGGVYTDDASDDENDIVGYVSDDEAIEDYPDASDDKSPGDMFLDNIGEFMGYLKSVPRLAEKLAEPAARFFIDTIEFLDVCHETTKEEVLRASLEVPSWREVFTREGVYRLASSLGAPRDPFANGSIDLI